jgi:hypothetical protein
MDSLELLAVTPELLAKAIIHRRERLLELIPEELEACKAQQTEAESMARSARKSRDDINEKVASLKKERNNAQKEAKNLFEQAGNLRQVMVDEGRMAAPEPKWAKDKLAARLAEIENRLETTSGDHKTEGRYINEMKALIREHEQWVEQRADSQPEFTKMKESQNRAALLMETAQKAHQAMTELAEANIDRHETYVRWEEGRRRSTSKSKRLDDALKSSDSAKSFWNDKLKEGFGQLLEDSNRVGDGGMSSKAIAREKKQQRESEEE